MTPPPPTGLLLAAGAGRRAGGPKALRTDEQGRPWVTRAVQVLREGGCTDVHVVVGAAAADVRVLLDGLDVTVVEATDWAQGMGASLRAGLEVLDAGVAESACVHLVDLPDVGADVVARVCAAADGPHVLARASYADGPGHPVLLGRAHWPGIREAARADHGARDYLAAHPPVLVDCADLAGGRDVDGPAGLASTAPTQTTEVPGA
jgi:CTP:molybdopterin cytidylyltransferase MocA